MRSALFWLVGASLAFLLTAGAFLVLANFGTALRASDPIPRGGPSVGGPQEGPKLDLEFSEEGLEDLEMSRNQVLTLYLENRGEGELRSVDLELAVYSEDTASPNVRRYRETVPDLAPGETEEVDLTVDLSPPPPVGAAALLGEGEPEGDRGILEARAYAPGAPAVVETAVVSP